MSITYNPPSKATGIAGIVLVLIGIIAYILFVVWIFASKNFKVWYGIAIAILVAIPTIIGLGLLCYYVAKKSISSYSLA